MRALYDMYHIYLYTYAATGRAYAWPRTGRGDPPLGDPTLSISSFSLLVAQPSPQSFLSPARTRSFVSLAVAATSAAAAAFRSWSPRSAAARAPRARGEAMRSRYPESESLPDLHIDIAAKVQHRVSTIMY